MVLAVARSAIFRRAEGVILSESSVPSDQFQEPLALALMRNRTPIPAVERHSPTVRILSDTGQQLATATLRKGENDLTLAVERVVHGRGRLFQYYFSLGRRAVRIESGDFRLNGTITTSWSGRERLWRIRLMRPDEVGRKTERTAQSPASTRIP